jgi:CHAD domain-containing protein
MAYKLKLGNPPKSLRKVARDQLQGAADGLRDPDDPIEAVHDARKRIKKTRALLRLARPAMRPQAFAVYNRQLRDEGRRLSGTRDADVLVETVGKLAARNTRRVRRAHFAALSTRFEASRTDEVPAASLDALLESVEAWPLKRVDRSTLLEALGDTYKRGRAAFAEAREHPTTENLHDWRKRAKDLWYQQQLLSRAWPDVMKSQAAEAKALSKLLGSDHDLAVLAGELDPGDPLHPLIADNRERLQRDAFELGGKIYAEKPKAFTRRLRRYVRAVA